MGTRSKRVIIEAPPSAPKPKAAQPRTVDEDVSVPKPSGTTVWSLADFDIGKQRALRKTSRGAGLLRGNAQLEPELCRVPLAAQYRQGNLDEARMWL